MNILGIHGTFGRSDHDAAAAVIRDGLIVAAAEEERFTRHKHATGTMPEYAIRYCLEEAGLDIREIDVLAFPRESWLDVPPRLKAFFEYRFGHFPEEQVYVHHHLAHAASAYYVSGFADALVVTLDQAGDGACMGVYRGAGGRLDPVHLEPYPNSLGLFASIVTQYLGFRSNDGEYKIMGLAAYGEPTYDLDFLLEANAQGYTFKNEFLHPEKLHPYPRFHTEQLPMFSEELERRLPPRRLMNDPITPEHANLAASAQRQIEESVMSAIRRFKQAEDRNLCLAGGVAQNSVMAGKLASSGLFDAVYLPPAPGDAGTALGSALHVAAGHGGTFEPLYSSLLGPAFSNDQIRASLERCAVDYREIDDPAVAAAELLARDEIVAWFQGRAEFGPRALGARSLLADPSKPEMKERVNRIKYREEFRPFAPSILSDEAGGRFDCEVFSPFMSFTLPVTETGMREFPAAVHVDGTSRLQTVVRSGEPYRRLLERFKGETGIPAVLNTSLNAGWEPIVLSPEHALANFESSAADALVMGNFVLTKS